MTLRNTEINHEYPLLLFVSSFKIKFQYLDPNVTPWSFDPLNALKRAIKTPSCL